MYITEDGIRLHAELDMPEGNPDRCPLAIVFHGFTGHMEETHIVGVARTLNGLGLAVLRVELYGHGKSDGEFRKHTLYKWLTNALTVIDYAKKLDFVTGLYLCGHSQGGLLVMLAAGMTPDLIKGIIPLSPACMIPEGARRGELLGVHFDPVHIPDVIGEFDAGPLDGNYIRAAQTIHVEDAIDRFEGPVLIVHGDADDTVPVEVGRAAAARYKNAQFAAIAGDTHCYDYHLNEVEDAIRRWFRENSYGSTFSKSEKDLRL